MVEKSQKRLLAVIVAASVGLAAVLAGLWYYDQNRGPTHSALVDVKVFGPGWTIIAEDVGVDNASALEALMVAGNEQGFSVVTQHYAGMGDLVVAINGTGQNNTHFWLFGINGVASDVGADARVVVDGDVVVFWYTNDFASQPPGD
jgi:hypothetical protein